MYSWKLVQCFKHQNKQYIYFCFSWVWDQSKFAQYRISTLPNRSYTKPTPWQLGVNPNKRIKPYFLSGNKNTPTHTSVRVATNSKDKLKLYWGKQKKVALWWFHHKSKVYIGFVQLHSFLLNYSEHVVYCCCYVIYWSELACFFNLHLNFSPKFTHFPNIMSRQLIPKTEKHCNLRKDALSLCPCSPCDNNWRQRLLTIIIIIIIIMLKCHHRYSS